MLIFYQAESISSHMHLFSSLVSFAGHSGCRQHDADPRGFRCGHEQVPRGGLRGAREPSSLEQHWNVFLWEKEICCCE